MKLATFHTMRSTLRSDLSPATGEELAGVAARVCDLLAGSSLFDWFEVEPSQDPDRLVIGLCHLHPDASEVVVAQLLERIWENGLAQPYLGSHVLIVEPGHVELEGAARTPDGARFVTVHLLATVQRLPEQRRPLGGSFRPLSRDQTPVDSRSSDSSFGGSTNR